MTASPYVSPGVSGRWGALLWQNRTHGSSVRIRAAKGSVRVEAAALFAADGDAHLENLIKRLFQLPAVQTIGIDRGRRAVVIDYDPDLLAVEAALRGFSDALRAPVCDSRLDRWLPRSIRSVERVERRGDGVEEGFAVGSNGIDLSHLALAWGSGSHHERVRRLVNLALGAGCFGMSLIGIMTPVIPTMPFVLATGYFLANSSQTLHDLFRRSPLFGEMLCDWEERGGWRLTTKLKLFALMVFLWGLTLAIAGLSWPLVITMGLMSGISMMTILAVPTVSDGRTPASPYGRRANRETLPAPRRHAAEVC